MPPALLLLTRFLVAKSVIDVVFVGLFAVGFYYKTFNPSIRGWTDDAGARGVSGWVVDGAEPGASVEVQLFVDGRFAESRRADFPRPDLLAAGVAPDERHGFFFFLPPLEEGEHEARVYAVHESEEGKRRTLQLLGNPARFALDATPAEPYFRGWLDEANAVSVRGWVVRREAMGAGVEVHLYIDGRFVESRAADQPRADLTNAGVPGDGRHGFFFFTPPLPPGAHEARAYVVHEGGGVRVLRLIGRPARFNVS